MANQLDRISIDPAVCGGKPCVRGTRVWVALVANCSTPACRKRNCVRAEYPELTHDDILAAIAYGAEASRERMIPLPVQPVV